ncbi:hypothetical protein GCM10017643_07550 [Ancylobacter dichloromethanicus]|uniref:Uncharacterized protein n=1 Tax=Ancylobacter dichloromethanicus TaxID=518825 RepID=A0A9W6J7G3_9HYPH|nr:hypothetical protein GCM10017643_07550 [Ancylobacter dichloromethanicus]
MLDERLHLPTIAPVERDRDHDKAIRRKACGQGLERGHFLYTGSAPTGPEIEENDLSVELVHTQGAAVEAAESYERCRPKRLLQNKLAYPVA